MVTIGIDAHKRTHTVVIVDEQGRQLAARTVGTTLEPITCGLLGWARQHDTELVWAVEDCRHLSRRLERDLLAAGRADRAGAAEADGGTRREALARSASPTRSTRSRSPARLCASRICRWRVWMGKSARCGCWSITARPGCRANPCDQPAALASARARPRAGAAPRARSSASGNVEQTAARLARRRRR